MKPIFPFALLGALVVCDAASSWAQPAQATPPEATPPEATPPEATLPSTPPPTATGEEDGSLSFNFETDFNSRYVFRGVALSQGPVVQPGLYLSQRGYTLGFWANINASRRTGAQAQARGANEVDVTFVKSLQRGRTTVEPAALLYFYPTNSSPTTGEISLRLARRYKRFSVFSSHSVDVLKYQGAYYGEIGLSKEREWSPRLSGAAKISLGVANAKYNQNNIGPRKSALNLVALDLSLTRMVNERFYVRPHLGYTRILDRQLREELDDPTIWNFGLALGSDF